MADILEWCKRMNRILNFDINRGHGRVVSKCVYGEYHFCDGSINKSVHNSAKETKPPCKHFKDGKCEFKLHLPN